MKKTEFDVLCLLDELKQYDEGYYANYLFKLEDEIVSAMNALRKMGYVSDNKISKEGKEELEKYRIDNGSGYLITFRAIKF